MAVLGARLRSTIGWSLLYSFILLRQGEREVSGRESQRESARRLYGVFNNSFPLPIKRTQNLGANYIGIVPSRFLRAFVKDTVTKYFSKKMATAMKKYSGKFQTFEKYSGKFQIFKKYSGKFEIF